MRRARATLAVSVVALGACREPSPQPMQPSPFQHGIVAHRGASQEAPENTLAALHLGWELGAESCEIDVRVTADGAVVLMHDETALRTTGLDRAVADLSLDEMRALDAGAWKGERWRGERVPTLAEALAIVPPGRMLFVEIKTGADHAPTIARAIRATAPGAGQESGSGRASYGAGAPGAVALQAYDADALAAAAELLPGVPTYWDVDAPKDVAGTISIYPTSIIDEALARGFTGLALDRRGLDDAFVAAVLAAGLSLDVWTVDDPAEISAWLARGARYVETNRPGAATP
jgi:glycerophosphoryl diester phosphodiesterase